MSELVFVALLVRFLVGAHGQTSDNRRQSWSTTGHGVSPGIGQGRTRRAVRQNLFVFSRSAARLQSRQTSDKQYSSNSDCCSGNCLQVEIVCETVDRRQTGSAAQVLVVVLGIVVCKTVDRRQTSSSAQVLIVVLETRRPRRPGDTGDPETLETQSYSETLETRRPRRPGDTGDPETLETRRPGDTGDPQPLGDTGDPETSETRRHRRPRERLHVFWTRSTQLSSARGETTAGQQRQSTVAGRALQ